MNLRDCLVEVLASWRPEAAHQLDSSAGWPSHELRAFSNAWQLAGRSERQALLKAVREVKL